MDIHTSTRRSISGKSFFTATDVGSFHVRTQSIGIALVCFRTAALVNIYKFIINRSIPLYGALSFVTSQFYLTPSQADSKYMYLT